jgi:hypothetical protein
MDARVALDWLLRLGPSEWIAAISALLAVLSFLFNWAVVRRQIAMQFEALRADRDSDLINWAGDVIEAMADAQKLCREKDRLLPADAFLHGQSEIRTRLSALLDRGRLFFPNTAMDTDDPDKEHAFRGKRQAALDAIYGVYRTVSDIGRQTERAPSRAEVVESIVSKKRIFVSEVFETVDPRRRAAIMSTLDYRRARKRQRKAARALAKLEEY